MTHLITYNFFLNNPNNILKRKKTKTKKVTKRQEKGARAEECTNVPSREAFSWQANQMYPHDFGAHPEECVFTGASAY